MELRNIHTIADLVQMAKDMHCELRIADGVIRLVPKPTTEPAPLSSWYFIAKTEAQMFETEALKETTAALVALRRAVKPFHDIALGSSGRIPTERLSATDWHNLWKAFKAAPPRGIAEPDKILDI